MSKMGNLAKNRPEPSLIDGVHDVRVLVKRTRNLAKEDRRAVRLFTRKDGDMSACAQRAAWAERHDSFADGLETALRMLGAEKRV